VSAALGAVGGALLGGSIGTTAERATANTDAIEYVVRQQNGSLVSVTQRDLDPLPNGTRVLVIKGQQARIVPDYTRPAEPPAPTEAPPVMTAPPPATGLAPIAAGRVPMVPPAVPPPPVVPAPPRPE
jgi:outer membrane lipoprotein SlyB